MRRRRTRGGLRAQLTLAISLVALVAVGASFLALYRGTGSRLASQVDTQLHAQASEWRQAVAAKDLRTPAAVSRAAQRFINGQGYHPESLIVVVAPDGAPAVSSDREVLAADHAQGTPGGLLSAAPGLTTADIPEAGRMRILTEPVLSGGRRVGTFRVAAPLSAISRAQSDLLRTFALVGALTLVLAIAAGAGLAALIASPLRRIARVAVAVDAGDLSLRAGSVSGRGEISMLAEAFDRMLDRLERAFKRQRDFASDASHELRTPLAVMRAQVELLDTETDRTRRHEGTAELLRRLDELDRLVGDLLTLASAEGGQLVAPAPFDLDGFFEDLRRDLPLYGDRRFRVEPVGGRLTADQRRVTQILRNLVRNAVTHTAPGGQVTITARPIDDHLRISVGDDGPGIPAGELEHVFERFHRIDPGRSRDRGGTGLGLAVARALAEAHGGRLWAESPPGTGAVFYLELPGYAAGAYGAERSDVTSSSAAR
ncbi:MAG TPA: HAMP domain-containing sensor histidine kinase [Solirubrobacteraceae bacterium]|nr:HAMP domain-containing sensor histidine kinase [Solirubrobacteraceae bacterium]